MKNIKICVRKRPNNVHGDKYLKISGNHIKITKTNVKLDLQPYLKLHKFTYDFVFDNISNKNIYETLINKNNELDRFIYIAFGHTGTGKTYTILGSEKENGILQYFMQNIFEKYPEIFISSFEIYNNRLYDLLNNRIEVYCRQDGNKQLNICNLETIRIHESSDIHKHIKTVKKNRVIGNSNLNIKSSRSHAIIEIHVKNNNKYNKVTFVDLAGNERGADSVYVNKTQYRENKEINKSLLMLKECIRCLFLKKKYIPYRSSKLTTVLRDSFSKDVKTILLSTISGDPTCYQGTIDTLKYANYVKNIESNFKFPPIKKPMTLYKKRKQTKISQSNTDKKFEEYLFKITDLVAMGFTSLRNKNKKHKLNKIFTILNENLQITNKFKSKLLPEPPNSKPKKKFVRKIYQT